MLFLTEDNDFAGTEQVSFGCSRSWYLPHCAITC